jgi:APA family basic amino acid/polyamine antiporter
MASLPWPTWRRLLVWFALGIVIYFLYGIRRSNLAQGPINPSERPSNG